MNKNNLKEKVLNIILQYPQYKLVGAYSIQKSINKDSDWDARATVDLDIRICIDVQPEKNIEHLISVLEENNLSIKVKITKNNNYKIFVFDDDNHKLKVDIEFKDGSDIQGNIKNINESLRDKMELVMLISDREFKNVVDIIICLQTEYAGGITKEQLLHIFEHIELHSIDIEVLLDLAKKFKPQVLNGMEMKNYALAFDTLLTGLLEDDIESYYIYKDFEWYNNL